LTLRIADLDALEHKSAKMITYRHEKNADHFVRACLS
jgi:hypothetical protein